MIEVSEAKLMTIRRDNTTTSANEMLEIITDSETYCPSIIGIKNPEENDGKCGFSCKRCWEKALADVEDFKILWKYKGSDEYV